MLSTWRHRAVAVVLATVTAAAAVSGAAPALAQPAAAPTVDPSAPTPTAPYPGGPPAGQAPDGSAVGGPRLAGRGQVLPPGAPALPADITAHGWLVADLDSGDVLAAQDPHGRYYPASTLKTLTFLALHDVLDPDQMVAATAEDQNVEGTKVGIVEGGSYPVQLLFLALMMQSGNDAANALARTAGGTEATLALMNDKAATLQAYDTVAGSPSGLDVAGQSSSPYDLALILRQIVSDPQMLAVMQTPAATMPAVPPQYPAFQFQNQNQLLSSYPGDLAGKTGFTDAARHTYVGAAERDGRRLVVSLMQGEQLPVSMSDQAARLLDWGFALPAGTPAVGRLVDPRPAGAPAPRQADGTNSSAPLPAVAARAAPGAAGAGTASGQDGSPPILLLIGLGLGSGLLVLLLAGRRRRH